MTVKKWRVRYRVKSDEAEAVEVLAADEQSAKNACVYGLAEYGSRPEDIKVIDICQLS